MEQKLNDLRQKENRAEILLQEALARHQDLGAMKETTGESILFPEEADLGNKGFADAAVDRSSYLGYIRAILTRTAVPVAEKGDLSNMWLILHEIWCWQRCFTNINVGNQAPKSRRKVKRKKTRTNHQPRFLLHWSLPTPNTPSRQQWVGAAITTS